MREHHKACMFPDWEHVSGLAKKSVPQLSSTWCILPYIVFKTSERKKLNKFCSSFKMLPLQIVQIRERFIDQNVFEFNTAWQEVWNLCQACSFRVHWPNPLGAQSLKWRCLHFCFCDKKCFSRSNGDECHFVSVIKMLSIFRWKWYLVLNSIGTFLNPLKNCCMNSVSYRLLTHRGGVSMVACYFKIEIFAKRVIYGNLCSKGINVSSDFKYSE